MRPTRPTTAFLAAALLAAPALADVVKLKSGASVDGAVLKRTERRIWVDVGPDVLSFDMNDVASVESASAGASVAVKEDSIFSTAVGLAELPPREQAKILGPAVIKVSTPGGLGSGVILSRDGYAITNAHVVQGETNLRATVWFAQKDGTLKRTDIDDVELVAVNNHIDLALVKLKHPDGKDFDFAPVQDAEKLENGQNVFAIGNPLGLERTLTEGVVSVPSMQLDGRAYIQTDTPINPGNSGGPLFNMRGEVVGITNMKITLGENVGFAIPARYVKDFVRHREAYAFDRNNPNSGHFYHPAPPRSAPGAPSELSDGSSAPPRPAPGASAPAK